MKNTDQPETDSLERVAKQVGEVYPAISQKGFDSIGKRATLAETFSVWQIANEIVRDKGLNTLAEKTKNWHSQINVEGQPELAVRWHENIVENINSIEIKGFLNSEYAKKISIVIESIDKWILKKEINHDANVRILNIPSFQLSCFWIYNSKENFDWITLISVHHPDNRLMIYKLTDNNNKEKKFYESDKFLNILRIIQPVGGIKRKQD